MVSAFIESFLVVEFCFYVLGIEPRTSCIQVLYPSAAELHSLSQGVLSSGARVLLLQGLTLGLWSLPRKMSLLK